MKCSLITRFSIFWNGIPLENIARNCRNIETAFHVFEDDTLRDCPEWEIFKETTMDDLYEVNHWIERLTKANHKLEVLKNKLFSIILSLAHQWWNWINKKINHSRRDEK